MKVFFAYIALLIISITQTGYKHKKFYLEECKTGGKIINDTLVYRIAKLKVIGCSYYKAHFTKNGNKAYIPVTSLDSVCLERKKIYETYQKLINLSST